MRKKIITLQKNDVASFPPISSQGFSLSQVASRLPRHPLYIILKFSVNHVEPQKRPTMAPRIKPLLPSCSILKSRTQHQSKVNSYKRSLRFPRPFYPSNRYPFQLQRKKKKTSRASTKRKRGENGNGAERAVNSRRCSGVKTMATGSSEKISSFSRRINDCLRRVIRRHQTSRSSSGIVYLATSPAGCAPSWVAQGRPLPLSQQ